MWQGSRATREYLGVEASGAPGVDLGRYTTFRDQVWSRLICGERLFLQRVQGGGDGGGDAGDEGFFGVGVVERGVERGGILAELAHAGEAAGLDGAESEHEDGDAGTAVLAKVLAAHFGVRVFDIGS